MLKILLILIDFNIWYNWQIKINRFVYYEKLINIHIKFIKMSIKIY